MAPIPDSSYFPSLDKCLQGDRLLISWKSAFFAILETENRTVLEPFFSDLAVQNLLLHPYNAFPEPSQQTKLAFDTKTSAINITPSPIARFDIKELKEDALWLGSEAKIDEISALRVVVQEYQSRAYAGLLGRLSNQEIIGIQEAGAQANLPGLLLSQSSDADDIRVDFDTQESRRLRILRVYLSERQFLLRCVNYLLQKYTYNSILEDSDSAMGKRNATTLTTIEALGQTIATAVGESDRWLLASVDAIKLSIEKVVFGSGWYKDSGGLVDIETEWTNTYIAEATNAMEIIFQILDISQEIPSSQAVLAWLRLAKAFNFFQYPSEDESTQHLIHSMQSVAAIISVQILSVGSCIDHIQSLSEGTSDDDEQSYISKLATVELVSELVYDLAETGVFAAGPTILGWSSILATIRLRVMNSRGDEDRGTLSMSGSQSDIYEDVLNKALSLVQSNDFSFVEFLARTAVDNLKALEMLCEIAVRLGDNSKSHFSKVLGAKIRVIILELINNSSVVGVQYGTESVSVNIAALTGGQSYWDVVDCQPLSARDDPLAVFLGSEDLVSNIIEARVRFPLEPLPFLEISRALAACRSIPAADRATTIVEYLESIPSFTYTLPDRFSGYETINEEQNNNSIRLTQTVDLFEPRRKPIRGYQDQTSALMKMDPDFCIPAGTYGRIVSNESGPRVAYLFHEYSGFKYLGKLLETFIPATDVVDATTGNLADRDSISGILSLFAHLVHTLAESSTTPDGSAEALRILEVASSGLSRNRDVISVVFDIFEEELQTQSVAFGSEVPLDLLNSCVQFIHALVLITPGRVWPLLARSSLLDLGRGSCKLASIVGSVELISGRYDLLLACTHLYEVLVEDLVVNAVTRRNKGKLSARFAQQERLGTDVPEHILSKVILSFTRYLIDVVESSCSWKFLDLNDNRQLRKSITATFDKVLRYAYGIEDSEVIASDSTLELASDSSSTTPKFFVSKTTAKRTPEPKAAKSGLMVSFEAAATYISDSFLSTSSGTLRAQPILRAFHDGFRNPDTALFINENRLCEDQVISSLTFSKTLLQVGSLLEKPASQLESQLFKASPLIARLYAVNGNYRVPVVALFEALVVSASINTTDPPSLLGYLGSYTSKNFLHAISRNDNTVYVMRFLSKVLSCRQQWFAKYLLSGISPKNALEGAAGSNKLVALDKSPLTTAFEAFTKVDDMTANEAICILDFISSAQNFWPWSTYDSDKHGSFIKTISEYVGTLAPIQQSSSLEDSVSAAYQTRMVAYIAEILAMHLFHSRQMGNESLTKDLIPNLDYFIRFAIKVPKVMEYNSSLHGNLKRNFEARYTGCRLLDFRRTTLQNRDFGNEYFYDIGLADKMLSFDQAWGAKHGFKKEVEKANVNLSCVDAQIALLHGWKFLALELSTGLSEQVDLQSKLARVASDCLLANLQNQGSEEIFQRLNQSRSALALILVQRLVETRSKVFEMEGLLTKIWETIRQSDITYQLVLSSGDPTYYRTLLKLLFLGLHIHSDSIGKVKSGVGDFKSSSRLAHSSPIIETVIDILDRVVAQGIRDIAAFIHERPGEASPEDLALVTGILQACLRIPGIELCYSQIVALFEHNSSARVAVTLFSWSDTLAVEGDPIYGELSILFLLELSTVPAMAEQLAIGGILSNISTASITTYLRGGNVSPFAEGAGLQRCYSIWVRGILPLVLNLLDSVGAAIASEASQFLIQFPALLKQSIEAFEPPASSRMIAKIQPKYMTLTMCNEAHTLSLIMFVLKGFREGAETLEMAEIKWDSAAMLDNAEFWLGSRAILSSKILPMGERDVALFKTKVASSDSNKLEESILAELAGVRAVLAGNA